MMPAAKHFDPVLGVDIHIVQPPGPVPPVPVPHPFIGMVVDPMDYVPFLGATVMVGGIPRAQAGTAGKNVPPHIPIGGVFVKPPGNECEVFMGSATVSVDGDAFSHLALPALSCQDVGMPPPPRPKKKSKTMSLVLPTSVVLSIPSGVFVGGPPTISLMALGMRAGMAAAGKLFKKAKAARKAKKGKAKKGKAKSKGKSKDNSPCGTDAHPVDVVTGACVDTLVDYAPEDGTLFRWFRHYDSSECERAGPMGRGFRHPYEMTLERTPDGFRYTDEMGLTVDFPPFGPEGEPVVGRGHLLRQGAGGVLEVLEPRERWLRFRALHPGGPSVLVEVEEGARRLRVSHDRDGRLAGFRDSSGRIFQVEHDPYRRITAIHERGVAPPHDVVHTVLRFQYDHDGCLVAARDALGGLCTYHYQGRRLTTMRDRRGYHFHYIYDDQGRVVHTTGEDGLWNARLEYLPEARMTVVHYADGGSWTKFFDENGMVTDVVQPDGSLLARRMNDEGRVAEEIDGGGLATTWEYDAFGSVVGRRDPLGRFLPPPWEDADPPDPDEPDPPLSAAGWEYGGRMDPDHPGAGRVPRYLLEELPAEARRALELDAVAGRGAGSRVETDALGRRTAVAHPDGSREVWRYDAEGNVVEHLDRDGSAHRRGYRSWNLLSAETDPLGNEVRYEHSLRGQVTRFVDPGGTATEYERDTMERITSVSRGGSRRESYRWTPSSRLLELRGPDGKQRVEDLTGPTGVPLSRSFPDGSTHTFGRDEAGRATAAVADGAETARGWDDRGRLVLDARDGEGVGHAYTLEGVAETTVLGKYTTRYEYRDRWSYDLVDPTGARHSIRLHPAGIGMRVLSSGRSELAHYGEGGRCLGKHLWGGPGGGEWTRRYDHSGTGRLRELRDSAAGTTRFAYDDAHRLVEAKGPDGREQSYRYDAAGNLLALPGRPDAVYGEANRLARVGGDRFEHDDRHHVSARHSTAGTIRYRYDAADMLVGVETGRPGGETRHWRAAYDPHGRRSWKEWEGGRVDFFWDGDRLAAERDAEGRIRVYVYADERALVPILFVDYPDGDVDPEDGELRFLFTNQVGVPERVEDIAGRVLWRGRIDPYGAVHVDPASRIELNLRFPGHYLDPETGLHYNRFRYYSPELGRYLQSDPIGLAGGPNVYAYPANPLAQVDLLGLTCKDAKGKTKGKGEGPPHSDARAKHQDVKDLSANVGMDPKHVKNLQERAARRGERIIVRGSNPESLKWQKQPYNGKKCVSKPVTVKHKTAKDGPHAGLVTKDANVDPKTGKTPDPPPGYKWDENGVMVKEPHGNAVHGDYDLQHVSEGSGKPVDTNDPDFRRDLNKEVCPEHHQFNHGANDDYRPVKDADGNVTDISGGDKPGRNPDPDESYLVVEPNGTAKQIDGTDNLQKYYEDNGMDWPYPDY